MVTESESLFHEEQRFQQKALWALMVFFFIVEFLSVIVPLFSIWVLGKTVDGSDRSDPIPVITGIFVITLLSGLTWLLWNLRLVTDVRRDGLYVQMIPIHRRVQIYPLTDITQYELVTYRPLRDYGGWGIRRGRKGRALNVRGNQGIMLQFNTQKPLLIGTQRPAELEQAMRLISTPEKSQF